MADQKKLKKLSKKRDTSSNPGAAKAIMDSANQIWLAGLGAFSKAQEEGGKIFDTLVSEGKRLESKTRNVASARIHEVRGAVEGTVGQVRGRATESIDKLEQIFENRVAQALGSLGVPTAKDVQELTARVEELQKAVDDYNSAAPAAKAAAPAKKKTTRKKATRKKATAKKSSS